MTKFEVLHIPEPRRLFRLALEVVLTCRVSHIILYRLYTGCPTSYQIVYIQGVPHHIRSFTYRVSHIISGRLHTGCPTSYQIVYIQGVPHHIRSFTYRASHIISGRLQLKIEISGSKIRLK